MTNTSSYRRPLISALFMGGIFAAASILISSESTVGIVFGTLFVAALSAAMTFRSQRGKPMLPTAGLVVLGLVGLALYTRALFVWEKPEGIEWIAVPLVFAFPVAVLIMAYRQWRAER